MPPPSSLGSSLFKNGQPDIGFRGTSSREAIGSERIIAAVDSKGGRVVVNGWKQTVDLPAVEAVQQLEPYCGEFLYTHVDKEGLDGGHGPGRRSWRSASATSRKLTAAGGITSHTEIALLDREKGSTRSSAWLFTQGRLDIDDEK